MASRHFRFDKFYDGPWPYAPADGVGLALTGYPTDVHGFIEVLQFQSCSPVATRRILDELAAGRTKFTTVRSNLDFNDIGDALAAVGVTMAIVPPAEPQDPLYDDVAFSMLLGRSVNTAGLSADELRLIESRLHQTQVSLARIPHGFGKFE